MPLRYVNSYSRHRCERLANNLRVCRAPIRRNSLISKGKQATRCFGTKVPVVADQDPYAFYRSPSAALWDEIQHENKATLASIDSSSTQKFSNLIDSIALQAPASIPECGPTGKFLYSTISDPSGRLLYARRKSEDESSSLEQIVLDLDLQQFQLIAMSLSPDECFLLF